MAVALESNNYDRERDRSPVPVPIRACAGCTQERPRALHLLVSLAVGKDFLQELAFCAECVFFFPPTCYGCDEAFTLVSGGDRVYVYYPDDELPAGEYVHAACAKTCPGVNCGALVVEWDSEGDWCARCHRECEECGRSLDGVDPARFVQHKTSHDIVRPSFCVGCAPADYDDDTDTDGCVDSDSE